MRCAGVHRLEAQAPDDVSAIAALIEAGRLAPGSIVAIFGKTEGNGCVNDFTRAFAVSALRALLSRHLPLAEVDRVALVMSGGTEGALSPHWLVFTSDPAPGGGESPALAIGRARTRALLPEEIGTPAQSAEVARGVAAAMADAGIADPDAVHYVQVKCPLLTPERIAKADARGAATATRNTLKSMALSRGASALGAAMALGEVPGDAEPGDPALYCTRCGASAGVELEDHEIVVMGLSDSWSGPLLIDHAVMSDSIDTEPVRAALARLGLDAPGQLPPAQSARLLAVMAKAEAAATGRVRGARHVMLSDSDISHTRHARAFVGGALASLVGFTDLFVSGGAEHQGPDGGGPVALIARRS